LQNNTIVNEPKKVAGWLYIHTEKIIRQVKPRREKKTIYLWLYLFSCSCEIGEVHSRVGDRK
jgi:hypothetical protein